MEPNEADPALAFRPQQKKRPWLSVIAHHGIMFKMLLRSLAMLTLTLFAVEYVSYTLSARQIERMTEEQQATLTSVYAERISKVFENIESDLKSLIAAPSLRDYYRNRSYDLIQESEENLRTSSEVFKTLQERTPGYVFLKFTHKNGKQLIHIDHRGKDVATHRAASREDIFPSGREVGAFRGITRSQFEGSHAVVFSSGVADGELGVIGEVEIGFSLDTLLGRLRSERLFDTGHLAVLDSRGEIVFFPGKKVHEPISVIHPGITRLGNLIRESEAGNVRLPLEMPYTVGFQSLPRQGWVVAAFAPERQMFAVLDRIKKIVLFIVGANVFIEILFLALFMRIVILKPIDRILMVTRKIFAGDLDARIEIRTEDEFAELGASFNDMTQSLQDGIRQIREANATLERRVEERTSELKEAQVHVLHSSKMAALGEMAGGIAHEINNPLATIKTLVSQAAEVVMEEPLDKGLLVEMTGKIESTTDRIAKIVQGLRSFSRDGRNDEFARVDVAHLIGDTLSFCRERYISHSIDLAVEKIPEGLSFEGRETEISQVLLNLLNNAYDAVEGLPERWVRISVRDDGGFVEIGVADSGSAVRGEVREKLFQPFFTTKAIGKGTGMGLSISLGIVRSHQGILTLDSESPNTRFVIRLPKTQDRGKEPKTGAANS